jgi:hypothetical protein
MVKNPATSLKRAMSSTARMFVIQGLRHGRWCDVYCYSADHGHQAKSVFNHIISMDAVPREIRMYRDFRLLPPVPDKLIKKAKARTRERREQRRQEAAEAFRAAVAAQRQPEAQQARKRASGGRSGKVTTTVPARAERKGKRK